MLEQEGVCPLDEHAAELHGCRRQAQHAVAAADHLGPHVVEQVGEQRQRARVLGRFLGRPAGDIVGEMIDLEAGGEKLGRPAHDLAQLRLAQGRHLDRAIAPSNSG